ncbi:proline-specific peptidase [Massarina eburnea CBS 473.64]|uniref:Proline-specific peptidase n=1 Tax=Massarina eburnea CBS 473.64 TaxID=1395130 RepID=A0A6A6RJD6_9PLEO|nr:proline-specific peptidase [Massarina eburnea CBS 473.64]
MTAVKTSEGKIPLQIPNAGKPCETWYKVIGDLDHSAPLITLHGGPGAGHEYLLPLIDLHTKYKTPIVFYDQVGCGNSTRLREKDGDETFWSVDLFISELENLVDFLGIRERGFNILGQSWGGMLGGVYAARKPVGLRKVILANPPASIPLLLEGEQKLMKLLPEDIQRDLEECHRNHDFESGKYKNACLVFYKRHLCRLDPWPTEVLTALWHLEEDPTVYKTMYGPSELFVTGLLRDWEGFSTAHFIEAETLLLNGRYDEVQDLAVAPWFRHIRKVKWVVLEQSSHMAHFEERERFMQIVGDFLEDEPDL